MPPTTAHEQVAGVRHDSRVAFPIRIFPSRDLPHGIGQPGDARRGQPLCGVARAELAVVVAAPDKEGAVLAHRGAVIASSSFGLLAPPPQLSSALTVTPVQLAPLILAVSAVIHLQFKDSCDGGGT